MLLQLESVALKGKQLPCISAFVDTMFAAELKNQLLTAGHDFDMVEHPLTLGIARGDESYLLYNGQEQTTKQDDMIISDAKGIISSVLYGPDARTRITEDTRNALFTVYAPEGIDETAVKPHLEDIAQGALLISPTARIEVRGVYK